MTLVSVVLALALTAALAACGSDEPSGGTGPDRTASPPTETPSSPTRTPSTAGSVDSAHCHRCAWTCGCDSAARGLRLRRNGPGSAGCPLQRNERCELAVESDNWLSDAPLGEWHGVITDDDGRVTELNLEPNGLSGEIPPELGASPT